MTQQKETRHTKIMVSVEESLYEAARNYAYRNNMSASGYVRSLIIRDLHGKGLLTNEDMMRFAT